MKNRLVHIFENCLSINAQIFTFRKGESVQEYLEQLDSKIYLSQSFNIASAYDNIQVHVLVDDLKKLNTQHDKHHYELSGWKGYICGGSI